MAYLVSKPGDKQPKTSVGAAVSRKDSVGRDQMDGNMSSSNETPYLRMTDNILEAKGRDVSNNQADVKPNGWGEDLVYKGMATDAPYGGMKK
jgi:hypothetical protein